MLTDYIPLCAPNASFLGTTSLNLPVDSALAEQGYLEIIEIIPDLRDNAEVLVMQNSRDCHIWQFIVDLPSRHKQIAFAVYWLGWSQKQVADFIGISPSAVSQSLKKIHEAGRNKLAFN